MGSSSSLWRRRVTRVLKQSLLLASLQMFSLLSSAGKCCSSDPVAAEVIESSSWLRRLGDDPHYRKPTRRALLQVEDVTSEQDAKVIPDQLSSTYTFMTVNQFGTGDYGTVQEAVDAVLDDNAQRVVIRIFSGTYKEKIYIPSNKPFITFLGIGVSPPVITWNATAASAGSTWKSGTVLIDAANFIATGITFENTAPAPAPGAVGAQAVAMRIGGDMAAFYGCSFLGAQDTLCDWMGRHYFQNCFIQGSIDFIFGRGQSLYERCTINSIAQSAGSVTAHYRQSSDDPSGFSFVNCNITGTGNIVLGRAWGPYSRVIFSMTTMANNIDSKGWGDWGDPSVDKTVFYGEYNNFGEGAKLSQRVSFSHALSQAEAEPFMTLAWINGTDWIHSPLK